MTLHKHESVQTEKHKCEHLSILLEFAHLLLAVFFLEVFIELVQRLVEAPVVAEQ